MDVLPEWVGVFFLEACVPRRTYFLAVFLKNRISSLCLLECTSGPQPQQTLPFGQGQGSYMLDMRCLWIVFKQDRVVVWVFYSDQSLNVDSPRLGKMRLSYWTYTFLCVYWLQVGPVRLWSQTPLVRIPPMRRWSVLHIVKVYILLHEVGCRMSTKCWSWKWCLVVRKPWFWDSIHRWATKKGGDESIIVNAFVFRVPRTARTDAVAHVGLSPELPDHHHQ